MSKPQKAYQQIVPSGFTLLEVMVTISIVLILAAIAVPGLSSLMQNNAISSYSNQLSGTLILAKSEASKRSDIVNFQAGNSWDTGWHIEDSTGTLIRRFDGIPSSYSVTATALTVGFRNDGSITRTTNYQITIQPASGCTDDLVRVITVSIIGNISVSGGTCS